MTAKFWFYPFPGNRLIEIDLGENVGELYSDYQVSVNDGVSLDGSIYRSVGRINEIVTIQRDRFALGEGLAVKFAAMQNHLQRGGSVAFCSDSSKSWAYPIIRTPSSGNSSVKVGANPFVSAFGSVLPVVNDYCVIESSNPGMIYEHGKISASNITAAGGGDISLVDKVHFNYDRASFIRYYRFWPFLKLPKSQAGKNIITNEHGVTFSLDLTLISDISGLMAFHPGSITDGPLSGSLIGPTDGGIEYGPPDKTGIGNIASSVPVFQDEDTLQSQYPRFE